MNPGCLPFVKYSKSKSHIIKQIAEYVPLDFENYYEIFTGSGTLFWYLINENKLENKQVYLSDNDKDLITTWQCIRDNPEPVIDLLKEYYEHDNRKLYYQIRDLITPVTRVEIAARWIYTHEMSFNGLYQINNEGKFKGTYGSYSEKPKANADNIFNCSKHLQNVSFKCCNYSDIIGNSKDFIYCDPPEYEPYSNYNTPHFNDIEQIKLFEYFKECINFGASIISTNSNTEFIKQLYKDYKLIEIKGHSDDLGEFIDDGNTSNLLILGI